MFDKVEIVVEAGDGGNGAITFRREKYVPYGGPDGGDGGNGGNVAAVADPDMTSLKMFQPGRVFRAEDGGNGRAKKMHGKDGQDLVVAVPPGTLVYDGAQPGEAIADLELPGQRVVLAKGGQGGWGNVHFKSSTNQAPRIAKKGESGEEKRVILELRLIADVGVIGLPNAGKSTLLAAASEAKPKIADYPFTTLEPMLGVVNVDDKSFLLADMPGLIEGAHLGKGLGHDFLRHIVRTRALIHLVDGTSSLPAEDLAKVNTELSLFDPALGLKPQLVAVNKIDLPEVKTRRVEIRKAFKEVGMSVSFISAANGEGVPQLMAKTLKMLEEVRAKAEQKEPVSEVVFRPKPKGAPFSVRKEGEVYVIESPELERVVGRVEMTHPEVRWQVKRRIQSLGIARRLESLGIQPGDHVRCGDTEWEW